jgi:hypothetical protein
MNTEQFFSTTRQVLTVAGMIAVQFGFLGAEKVGPVVDAVIGLAGSGVILYSLVWGILNKTPTAIIAQAATQTDANGQKLIKVVELNSLAQGARELERATPSNVVLPQQSTGMGAGRPL